MLATCSEVAAAREMSAELDLPRTPSYSLVQVVRSAKRAPVWIDRPVGTGG